MGLCWIYRFESLMKEKRTKTPCAYVGLRPGPSIPTTLGCAQAELEHLKAQFGKPLRLRRRRETGIREAFSEIVLTLAVEPPASASAYDISTMTVRFSSLVGQSLLEAPLAICIRLDSSSFDRLSLSFHRQLSAQICQVELQVTH